MSDHQFVCPECGAFLEVSLVYSCAQEFVVQIDTGELIRKPLWPVWREIRCSRDKTHDCSSFIVGERFVRTADSDELVECPECGHRGCWFCSGSGVVKKEDLIDV